MALAVFLGAALSATVAGQQSRLGVPRGDGGFTALGSPSCRACHRDLYLAWARSVHARAAEALTFEERFDRRCTACHVPDADAFEEGVGCEACHGPGSAYADLYVMIDPFKRRAAGLQDPRESCTYCHNPGHDDHVDRDLEAATSIIHRR